MSRRPTHACRSITLAGILAFVACATAAVSLPASAAAAVNGTVAGTVFEDFNANGAMDPGSNAAGSASATDAGVKGATVTVTDASGNAFGPATTDSAGAFSVAVTGASTAEVRVQVTPPAPFTAGPQGAGSATTVQFVSLNTPAAGAVNVALARPGDYSPDAPRLVVAAQSAATDGSVLINQASRASIVSSAHADRGLTPLTTEATADQTGAVWGIAQLDARYAFSAAFFRRAARTGPGGLGRIYLTDLSGSPNATAWASIPLPGANPREVGMATEGGMSVSDWTNDVNAVPAVGRIGLGGLAMAPNRRSLYVINLNSRSMWNVPFTLTGGAPAAQAPSPTTPLPLGLPGAAVGCPSQAEVRPFGVTEHEGSLWVTLTCTGPVETDLRGYVYRYDPGSGTFDGAPAFEMPLSGYSRGCCGWQPWSTSPGSPAPWLSDVAFDANGDMTIGVKDLRADAGFFNPSSGDVLRACRNAAGTAWDLESNAVCGARTGAGPSNGQGPGGGEFYDDDLPNVHKQLALGGLLQLPGYGEIINTTFDPGTAFNSDGYRFLSNADGANDDYHQISGPGGGGFNKSGGLGDMAALVGAAPLELGNRVWLDGDRDGIQDAGEANLAGVTVHLYAANGTSLLATATTDAGGNYYFSSAAGTSSASAIKGISGLQAQTNYVVKLDHAPDYAAGGPLASLAPTTISSGPNRAVDSNGATTGGVAQAAVGTGAPGEDDHTIDFGFRAPGSEPTEADLEVVKRADHTVVQGNAPITWTLTVTNHGPATATGVILTDFANLPVAFTFASSTAGTCTTVPAVKCQLGTIAVGATVLVTLVGRPRVAGTLINTARVTGQQLDPRLANNVSSATTRVRARLRLRKTATPTTVHAGAVVRFRIRVTNPTAVRVQRVRVCDRLPPGFVYLSSSPTTVLLSGGRHCRTFGTLAPGASRTLRIKTRTACGIRGLRVNVARVTGRGVSPHSARARVRVVGRCGGPGGGVTG